MQKFIIKKPQKQHRCLLLIIAKKVAIATFLLQYPLSGKSNASQYTRTIFQTVMWTSALQQCCSGELNSSNLRLCYQNKGFTEMFVEKSLNMKFEWFCYCFEMQTKLSGTFAKCHKHAKLSLFIKLGDTQPLNCAWHSQFSFI